MRTLDNWTIAADVKAAIEHGASVFSVPLGLMYSLAAKESDFIPTAQNYNPPREDSRGLFQLNLRGGFDQKQTGIENDKLYIPAINAFVAARTLSERFAATGSWYEAASPWAARDLAWQLWVKWAKQGLFPFPPEAVNPSVVPGPPVLVPGFNPRLISTPALAEPVPTEAMEQKVGISAIAQERILVIGSLGLVALVAAALMRS